MTHYSRVLIVDDEPSACKTIKMLLYQQDYDLAFVTSGPEAIAYCQQTPPDIILLDVMMPEMDGFEIAQYLKADDRWRHIPIILITALDTKEELVRGLEAGADEFLSKPVNSAELQARVRSMLRIKRQYDDLQAALQLREDLARMVVHDMRIPLTTILGYSELLLTRSNLTPNHLADIERIHTQANRLQAFTNDLLMMAKMENHQLVLNRTAVDITQLVQTVEQSHQVIANSRGIKLVIDIPEVENSQIWLDTNLFQRVLDNLLSNALKFSPAGTTVTLRVELPEPTAPNVPAFTMRVKVTDEGPGIAVEHHNHIFDKFGIVALKQQNLSQVGLGLAFCKLVVEAHGGKISVTNNQPKGTVFTVEI